MSVRSLTIRWMEPFTEVAQRKKQEIQIGGEESSII